MSRVNNHHHMQDQQQQAMPMLLPQGNPNDEYYYEQMNQEEYIGDYLPDGDVCCNVSQHMLPPHIQPQQPPPPQVQMQPQQQQQQQVAAAARDIDPRRGDVTELYRRRCAAANANAAAAELYSSNLYHTPIQNPPEYYYEQPRMSPSAAQLRIMQQQVHPMPPVYRKRIIPLSTVQSGTTYNRVMLPPGPPQQPPTQAPLPQQHPSQTHHYITNEDVQVLHHQQQQQKFEQLLQAQQQHQMQQKFQRQFKNTPIQHQEQQQQIQPMPPMSPNSQMKRSQPDVYRVANVQNLPLPIQGRPNSPVSARCNENVNRQMINSMDQMGNTIPSNLNNMNSASMNHIKQMSTSSNLANNLNGNNLKNVTSIGGIGPGQACMIPDNRRMQQGTRSAHQAVGQPRRHPITVRTPRYVRRPINSNLYKRPSTLCLPLSVQPDPALFGPASMARRMKRSVQSNEGQMQGQQQLLLPPSQSYTQQMRGDIGGGTMTTMPLNVNSSTDMPPTCPLTGNNLPTNLKRRINNISQRYDRLFRNGQASGDANTNLPEADGGPFENIDIFDKFENLEKLGKMDKSLDILHMKPRTPPCLKEKGLDTNQSKISCQLPEMMKAADTLQVQEMTTDMLDELLNELSEKGLNDSVCDNQRQKLCEDLEIKRKQQVDEVEEQKYLRYQQEKEQYCQEKKNNQAANNTKPEKDFTDKNAQKSFTYCELKQSQARPKITEHNMCNSATNTQNLAPLIEQEHEGGDNASEKPKEKEEKNKNRETERARDREADRSISSKKSTSSTTSSITRSKTKIIPRILVDNAMELHRTKSYVINLIDTALSNHLGTSCHKEVKHKKEKTSFPMLKKESNTSSKASQKDLAEEIAQILSENFNTRSRHSSISSHCSCKSSSHEPLFVKQLRQMRWGHLKHIQQEVRRLEELERFLDSCNLSTFEKCHYH